MIVITHACYVPKVMVLEEYWFDDDKKVEEWTKALYQVIGDQYDR